MYFLLLRLLLLLNCFGLLSSYSYAKDYPKTIQERKNDNFGSILDSKGLIFTPRRIRNESTKTEGRQSNKFLWQAAIEAVSFMPFKSSGSNSGVIITDWYSAQSTSTYCFRVDISIKDNVINPDAIEVKAYERRMKNNQWQGSQNAPAIGVDFEKKILNRARELYNQAEQNNSKQQ
ncbi:MAG: DUF3576 domain-containing protein [Rickettsiaceae bacterium]|nr:MAG: DUF3576 domain-containing protein [Rickettsiaceae bacterium]